MSSFRWSDQGASSMEGAVFLTVCLRDGLIALMDET